MVLRGYFFYWRKILAWNPHHSKTGGTLHEKSSDRTHTRKLIRQSGHFDTERSSDRAREKEQSEQRRVKHWKATEGPEKAIIFRQSLPAGLQGLSDFTHPRTKITISGCDFKHLLYQYRLAFSGFRHVHIVQGGESYSALAEGLQNALSHSGGSPKEHRTDSLSAAYVNAFEKEQLTEDDQKLCEHYGMRATRNNLGISHENGAIETAHGTLKHRIEQAIKLRGSSDFEKISDYRHLLSVSISKTHRAP